MGSRKQRGEEIRQFILDNVEKYSTNIAAIVSKQYAISRQAVNKHIKMLIDAGELIAEGSTRNRTYNLSSIIWNKSYRLDSASEGDIWVNDLRSQFSNVSSETLDIWHYGLTEMINNAIDHSSGQNIEVSILHKGDVIAGIIHDDGEGIFKKIKRELNLLDERHSILELAKGKLTTDPENHSGEGIFFSSRMFDQFDIRSGNVIFTHNDDDDLDWVYHQDVEYLGTMVVMSLNINSLKTSNEVFDQFTTTEDYTFSKTIIPVRMAEYGDDKLISRSQAKRVLMRVEKFKTVVFDFSEVVNIGQGFADEIFRVFVNAHPDMSIQYIYAEKRVEQMILRALNRI